MASVNPAAIHSLVYSLLPVRRQRRWLRYALGICLIAIIGVLLVGWLPKQIRLGRYLYWQRQCASYSLPPETIVFDDGMKMTGMAADGSGECFVASRGITFRRPACLARLDPQRPAAAVLFMHSRRSPSGVEKLVIVEWKPDVDVAWELRPLDGADAESRDLIGWSLDGNSTVTSIQFPPSLMLLTTNVPEKPRLRVFAGQPDPEDASHFTIAYEFGGAAGLMDGHLSNSGLVLLEERPGPARIAIVAGMGTPPTPTPVP